MADSTLVNTFTSFANAIREKEGSTGLIPAVDMGNRIRALSSGGGFPNGTAWTQSNLMDYYFPCVYNANGIWVAGSSGYGLYYSTDGKTWTRNNNMSETSICIYNANGIWVAGCGYDCGLYYSTDGITWTQSNITGGDFYQVYNANGIWVAASYGNGLYYSTDGKTWTQSNVEEECINTIHNAGGIWVAGGDNLWYSINGKTWTQSNATTVSASDVFNANGIWVACGSDGIYYSITWEKPATLIEFTIETDEVVTYQAEEGMTWAEWIASDFNTGGWYDDGTGCIYDGVYLINDPVIDFTVNINDNIVANRQYTC